MDQGSSGSPVTSGRARRKRRDSVPGKVGEDKLLHPSLGFRPQGVFQTRRFPLPPPPRSSLPQAPRRCRAPLSSTPALHAGPRKAPTSFPLLLPRSPAFGAAPPPPLQRRVEQDSCTVDAIRRLRTPPQLPPSRFPPPCPRLLGTSAQI